MLNRRNLIIIAAMLVVLVGVSLLQQSRHEAATSQSSSELLVAGEIARADLSRLVIGFGDQPEAVVLAAGDDHWTVESAWGARADQNKIDTLLRTLSGLRGEFRSASTEVLADYGFTDSTTVTLRAADAAGEEVLELEIGDKPQRTQGNFVKRPGEASVYLSTANVLGNLGLWSGPDQPQNKHFLDLKAYRGDREQVERIELASGEGSFTLVKDYAVTEPAAGDTTGAEPSVDYAQWDWTFGDGEPAKKTAGDTVLNAVVNLRAQDVVDPGVEPATYGLADPARTVTVQTRDGETVALRFGDELESVDGNPGGVYAAIGDDPTVWLVSTYTVDNIFKAEAELQP